MATNFVPWVKRAPGNPILSLTGPAPAGGVASPCLLRAPDWEGSPVAGYLLYASTGPDAEVWLATGPSPEGPFEPGEQVTLDGRAATGALDAHVDHVAGAFRAYLRTPAGDTVVARSSDAVAYRTEARLNGLALLRTFRHAGAWWAITGWGTLARSDDGRSGWVEGGRLLSEAVRGVAALPDGDCLRLFFSEAGDCPERILHAAVDLRGDWRRWTSGSSAVVLEPEETYEGVAEPLATSKRGPVAGPVRQLRHPAVHVEGEQRWLLYTAAGEQVVAIARFVP